MKKRFPIRRKLILLIVLPFLAVYGIVAMLQTRMEADAADKNILRHLSETTAHHASECEVVFSAAAEVAEGLARHITIRRPDSAEQVTSYIRRMLDDNPNIVGSTVAFDPGMFPGRPGRFSPYLYRTEDQSDTGPQVGKYRYKDLAVEYDYRDWDWYATPVETGKPSWSEPYFDEFAGVVLMCTYSVPFFFEGKLAGVATIDISLDEIKKIISGIAPDGADYFLVSSKGTIIASPVREWEMKESAFSLADRYHFEGLRKMGEEMVSGKTGTYRLENPIRRSRDIFVFSPLRKSGWSLLAELPEASLLRPIYQRLATNVLIFFLGLLVIVANVVFISRMITLPLERLALFAQKLADGHLDATVQGVSNNDEIGQLAQTFNQMAGTLRRSIDDAVQNASAKEMAEAANRAKSEFLMLVSHELRTPLSGSIGATDLLAQTPLDSKQQEYLDILKESDIALLLLISNILDYSKLDLGGITVEKKEFSLRNLIDSVCLMLKFQSKAKNLSIEFEFENNLPEWVFGDEGRVRQVLSNLLSNAVKFSENGIVLLRISSPVAAHAPRDHIRFEIVDHGVGVEEKQREELFHQSWKENTSSKRHYDGMGLGLALSKYIVDSLEGTIGMCDTPGGGSTFWFEIPLVPFRQERKTDNEAAMASASDTGKSGSDESATAARILVAEDNRINQIVIREILANAGFDCELVDNGRKAIEAWKTQPFDLILMDCQMPEIDGYEATKRIRHLESEEDRRPTPIIALTANSAPGDRERCLRIGMNSYCNKPVNAQELVETIQDCLEP